MRLLSLLLLVGAVCAGYRRDIRQTHWPAGHTALGEVTRVVHRRYAPTDRRLALEGVSRAYDYLFHEPPFVEQLQQDWPFDWEALIVYAFAMDRFEDKADLLRWLARVTTQVSVTWRDGEVAVGDLQKAARMILGCHYQLPGNFSSTLHIRP